MMKHKWHKEIKAWADGAEIEYKNGYRKMCWTKCEHPTFEIDEEWEYRIKPQPVKPQYLDLYIDSKGWLGIKNTDSFGNDLQRIGKIKLEVDDDTSGT